MIESQSRLMLTAHPLQRIGAFTVAALARRSHPSDVDAEAFCQVVERLREEATRAALVRDTKQNFWLKCSLSFFPNSPMAHPSNGKKDDSVIIATVSRWRAMPEASSWPGADCVLCGRQAVRFYGKVDIPLAESDIYRNSTPRGHEGMALCWPCVVSFHALPYGCRLSGGPAAGLHSWDERLISRTTARQTRRNLQIFEVGAVTPDVELVREVIALRELRHYSSPVRADVELLLFTNNNRGQALTVEAMDQPLAEWLRRTARSPDLRRGFGVLIGAHWTPNQAAIVGLARNAFRAPDRILGAAAALLARSAERGVVPDYTADLAAICRSFAIEVEHMNPKDLTELEAVAARVAMLLATDDSGGKLKEFYATLKSPSRMQAWLLRRAVDWLLVAPKGADGPLVTARGNELLFDPDPDVRAWFNRRMLLVAVLEQLHANGWRPADAQQVAEELAEEQGADGLQILDAEGEE
ncbi:Cas8a1 family CRISPR/Cas system-associated protein [Actinomadura sp. 9N407]|uniref:Cas8a1 family CRISPR/Cas system-associated protein n=1 Tax=Actinomadura sp. 9N407 TaxID=3375154 RepID=UPI0037A01826